MQLTQNSKVRKLSKTEVEIELSKMAKKPYILV